MKEMIKRIKEERGGFTLAELLVVVAIVAVLVAIAVPVFTGALGSANAAVGQSAVRSVKAEAVSAYLLDKTVDKTKAQDYHASVDEKGNVTNLTKGLDTNSTLNENSDAEDVGKAIAAGNAVINVTVTGEDVTKATGTITTP